jgi:hypothetical protein
VAALRVSPQVGPLLRRGAVLGATGGFLLGGAAGTWGFPLVGTFWWGVPGGALGALVGVLTALAVLALTGLSVPRWALGACGVVVGGCLAAAVMWLVRPAVGQPGGLAALIATAGALGAGLGPLIAFGPATTTGSRWPDHAAVIAVAKPVLVGGAAIGAAVGGVVGLVVGVVTYLPTSPVAMVEGGLMGATSGLLVALVMLLVVVSVRTRVRH